MATKAKQPPPAAATAKPEGGSLIQNQKLKQLYVAMLQYRLLEQRALLLDQDGASQQSDFRLTGHEATEVGCTVDLKGRDAIALPCEDQLRGLLEKAALRTQLGGRQRSGNLAKQPVEQLLASADRLKKTNHLVVAFADDLSRSPESWQQAFRMAGSQSLPILFVQREKLSGKPAAGRGRSRGMRAEDYGFPGIPVDGHDVIAVYRVAHEAIHRARRGGGPTLIECLSYLVEDGPANGSKTSARLGLRNRSTAAQAKKLDWKPVKDPIQRMEQYLTRKGLFQEAWRDMALRKFSRELDAHFGASPQGDVHQAAEPGI
jgi:TPP-dependent pyruvate/acetoin dehydrogenase alpha subunit